MSCYNTGSVGRQPQLMSWCKPLALVTRQAEPAEPGWAGKLYLQQDKNIWHQDLAHSSQDTALIR